MIKHLIWTASLVFVVVGLFTFVPGTTTNGYLFGMFLADPLFGIIYLVIGFLGACAGIFSGRYAVLFFQILGTAALVAAGLGIIRGEVFGLFNVNTVDNVFHGLIALGSLWVGFGMKHDEAATTFERV